MSFDVGALVKVRGREWVVLPESNDDPEMLILRPLGGTEDEVTGIYLPLEDVQPAKFVLPDPATDRRVDFLLSLPRAGVSISNLRPEDADVELGFLRGG